MIGAYENADGWFIVCTCHISTEAYWLATHSVMLPIVSTVIKADAKIIIAA
jgi:hypothetical protein